VVGVQDSDGGRQAGRKAACAGVDLIPQRLGNLKNAFARFLGNQGTVVQRPGDGHVARSHQFGDPPYVHTFTSGAPTAWTAPPAAIEVATA
jgi:hypothetical protein